MEITSKFLKRYSLEGLTIQISLDISGHHFGLPITFENQNDDGIDLLFGNAYRDVEAYQLVIMDKTDQRVSFAKRTLFRPREDDLCLHYIGPRTQWTYRVEGKIDGSELAFPNCSYVLYPGEEYSICYKYPYDKQHNYKSNTLTWIMPNFDEL